MKSLFAFALLLVSTLAEPPVNRYLPPQASNRALSQTYGAPSFGRQNGAYRKPSSTYGAPSRNRPNSQYLPPNQLNQRLSQPTNQYLPPTNQYLPPTNQYLPPTNQYQMPTNQYLPPTNQYQAPTNQYLPPTNQYQAPSNQYGLPIEDFNESSQEYGTPANRGNNYQQENRKYLPPSGGYDDGSNGEPANYNFEYMVKDDYSGNDFGHRESRQGDRAEGIYYVLLPDGRKQTVKYEADQNGYRPRISYEDTGIRTGYDNNSQNYDGPY